MATEFKVSEKREKFEVNGLPGIRTYFADGGVEEKVELADGRFQTYYFKPNYILYNRIDYPDGSWTMHEYPYGSNIEMITENDGNGNETTTTLSSIDKRVLNKETTYNHVISSTSGTDTPAAAPGTNTTATPASATGTNPQSSTGSAPGTNPTTTSASATGTDSQSSTASVDPIHMELPNVIDKNTETDPNGVTTTTSTLQNDKGIHTVKISSKGNYKRTEIIQPDKTSTVIIENGDNVTTIQKDSDGNIIDTKTEFPTTVNGEATGGKTTINEKTNLDGSSSIEKTDENGTTRYFTDDSGNKYRDYTNAEGKVIQRYSLKNKENGEQLNLQAEKNKEELKEALANSPFRKGDTPKSVIDRLAKAWTTDGATVDHIPDLIKADQAMTDALTTMDNASEAILGFTMKLTEETGEEPCGF